MRSSATFIYTDLQRNTIICSFRTVLFVWLSMSMMSVLRNLALRIYLLQIDCQQALTFYYNFSICLAYLSGKYDTISWLHPHFCWSTRAQFAVIQIKLSAIGWTWGHISTRIRNDYLNKHCIVNKKLLRHDGPVRTMWFSFFLSVWV